MKVEVVLLLPKGICAPWGLRVYQLGTSKEEMFYEERKFRENEKRNSKETKNNS